MSGKNMDALNSAREHFNQGNLEGYLNLLYDANVVLHFLPPGLPPGYEGAQLFYGGFLAGFPDAQLHFDDVLAEGDKIVVRFHLEMTHTGDFNGIPPTGKRVGLSGIRIMRYANGKVVECWSESDMVGLMQQLGVMPAA